MQNLIKFVFIVLFHSVSFVFAQAQISTQIEKEEKELAEIRNQLKATRAEVRELKGKEVSLLENLEEIEKELELTHRMVSLLKGKEERLTSEVNLLEYELSLATERMGRREKIMEKRLREIYKHGSLHDFEILLIARSFTDFARRYKYLKLIATADRLLYEEIKSERERIQTQKQDLERKLQALSEVRSEKEREEENIQQEKKEKDKLLVRIRSERAEKEKMVKELEQAAKKLQRLIEELERQRKEALAKKGLPPPRKGTHYFEIHQGSLPWPLEGRVISFFGKKQHQKYGTAIMNNGIDLEAPPQTKVCAIGSAKVVYADRFLGYGKMVLLDHNGGFYTLYSQLGEIFVYPGDEIRMEQPIGSLGGAFYETSLQGEGVYLHFEIRQNGKPVDPLKWLRRR